MVAAANRITPYAALAGGQQRQAARQGGAPQMTSMLTGGDLWSMQAHRGDPTKAHESLPQGADIVPFRPRQAQIDPNGPAPALQRARANGDGVHVGNRQRFANRQDEQLYEGNGEFNPRAFGGERYRDGIRQAVSSPTERMFDRYGRLNANDKKDALQQIAYFMQSVSRQARQAGARFYRREASREELEARREVLAEAVQDQEGFRILGQELLLPIKEIVDYEGWARRVFRVRHLQQGEYFRMAKDVRATAYVIGQDGQGIEARLGGKWVTPNEFKIGSFPTVDIEDIYLMNYDVLDRAQDTARQEVELEEDKRARFAIDNIAQAVNTVTTYATLGIGAFEDVRYQVERHRLVVEHFLINRAELSDIVKTMSANVDPVTERELILAGYIGSILNATIMTAAGTGVQEVVPAGTFYATTGPDYLGEMGIRIELFSEPFNMFANMKFVKGWAMGQMLGFVTPNGKCAAKGQK